MVIYIMRLVKRTCGYIYYCEMIEYMGGIGILWVG